MNKTILVILGLVVIIGGWLLLRGDDSETVQETPTVTVSPTTSPTPTTTPTSSPKAVVIKYTATGYSPLAVTIEKGTEVTFLNESDKKMWPASAKHPTHTVYPGSDIKKCGSSTADTIFDACKGLEKGQSWSFTFNEVGTWLFHDHISPGFTGTVIITQ